MDTFALLYQYPPDSEEIHALRPRHREFLAHLKEQGKLVGSGPFTDEEGGALIVIRLPQGSTLEDAEALMNQDPFYSADALTGRSIRPWNPVLNVFT